MKKVKLAIFATFVVSTVLSGIILSSQAELNVKLSVFKVQTHGTGA